MDSYPSKFVDLLTSQQTVSFGNYEVSEASNFDGDTGPERRERHSSTSQATANKRPPGVKSAKASGKKKVVDENAVNERLSKFESMFTIKERLTKMTLLDSLIRNREEGLGEDEEALRKKLIKELMST
ncbi:hypothetical protein YC2023_046108 [Brassica napus]